jgi:cytochrome b6-f complex iron-sulfur subunit
MKKIDRREALLKLAGLGAGVAGLGLCAGCPGGSSYGREAAGAAGAIGNAAGGRPIVVNKVELVSFSVKDIVVDGRPGYLYRGGEEGEWHAVDRLCTHKGCKVDFNANGLEYVCPCHGSKFAVDGEVLNPPARMPLKRYTVVVNDNTVEIIPPSMQGPEQAG